MVALLGIVPKLDTDIGVDAVHDAYYQLITEGGDISAVAGLTVKSIDAAIASGALSAEEAGQLSRVRTQLAGDIGWNAGDIGRRSPQKILSRKPTM